MLSQHPVDVYDMVFKKSEIIQVPTLDEKYYHLSEMDVDLDEDDINIAYFGAYYPNRHFESIFYAFDSLNHKFRDKLKFHFYFSDTKLLKELIKGLDIESNMIIHDIVDFFDFLNLTTKFDVLIVNDLVTKGNFKINPYLPSKIADYEGSGNDIWAIYESGSVASKSDVRYKSDVSDYSTSRQTLVRILEDRGFIDENLSFDEDYIDKRLTLFNESLSLKHDEIIRLNKEIKKLKSKNKKLKKTNKKLSSSEGSKIKNAIKKWI